MALLVYVTVPDEAEARHIARTLVEAQLAAGVNILHGANSIYRWQGAICDEAEWRLMLKTRRDLFEPTRARIRQLHPYDCPQIVAVDIAEGHAPYLDWIDACVRPIG